MAIKKEKKDKIAVRPKDMGQMTLRRPLSVWADMDHLFDVFRSDLDDLFWPWVQERRPVVPMIPRRTPPMNIADMGNHYEMKLEMPGIDKGDINIEVTPKGIEINAEKRETKEEKDANWLRRECTGMSYHRVLELPEELKTDDVDAELQDGVLTVTLPKLEPKPEDKPKKVRVR